jgi:two-component sensor histidine kinase
MGQTPKIPEKRRYRARYRAGGLSIAYLAFGSLWILFSDALLVAVYPTYETQAALQLVKGLGFVVFTAMLLFWVVYRLLFANEVVRGKTRSIQGDRDLLLREMHHRIKNNLQFVISMLGIQRNASRSTDVYDALGVSQERTRALALANSALYRDALSLRDDNVRSITPVIEELIRTYQPFIALGGGSLDVHIDLGGAPLYDEILVPVSLSTSEVLSLVMQMLERSGGGNTSFRLRVYSEQDTILVELRHPLLGTSDSLSRDSLDLLSGFTAQSSGTILLPDAVNPRLCLSFRVPSHLQDQDSTT